MALSCGLDILSESISPGKADSKYYRLLRFLSYFRKRLSSQRSYRYQGGQESSEEMPSATCLRSFKSKIAQISILIVLSVSFVASFLLINIEFTIVGWGYLVLQIAYSIWLKRIIIMDTLAIAGGFALRVIAELRQYRFFLLLAHYLYHFLSLFLAFGKRDMNFFCWEKMPGSTEGPWRNTTGLLNKW